MKKERVKGLQRMLVKAEQAESTQDKIIERLATWGVQMTLGIRPSEAVSQLIASGWSPPRTQRVAATKQSKDKFAVGNLVALKDEAALDLLDTFWPKAKDQTTDKVENLVIVAVKRKSDKPNAPRRIILENKFGNRFEVAPSQLKV